jgi:hypothetical protein
VAAAGGGIPDVPQDAGNFFQYPPFDSPVPGKENNIGTHGSNSIQGGKKERGLLRKGEEYYDLFHLFLIYAERNPSREDATFRHCHRGMY